MNIEKIKNYNQKLLAILGTIGGICIIIILISFISLLIQEHRRFDYNEPNPGILSEEKIEKLQKENKREQVISYETPILIDTLQTTYIIPVSHKTLNEKEDIGLESTLNAFASSKSNFKKGDLRYSKRFYGEFNNVIVYNPTKNTNKKLFDNRVNFQKIKTEYFENEILVLINASEKDTFKDGVINLKDFSSLYIYSFKEKEFRRIGIAGMDVYNYKFINNSKDLIIEFGIDKNKDGSYDNYNEPTIIKKYDFKKKQLIEIINSKINSELQKTLEGTKNN